MIFFQLPIKPNSFKILVDQNFHIELTGCHHRQLSMVASILMMLNALITLEFTYFSKGDMLESCHTYDPSRSYILIKVVWTNWNGRNIIANIMFSLMACNPFSRCFFCTFCWLLVIVILTFGFKIWKFSFFFLIFPHLWHQLFILGNHQQRESKLSLFIRKFRFYCFYTNLCQQPQLFFQQLNKSPP